MTFCNNKVFCSHNGWSRENGNRAADTNNDGCRLAGILVLARDNGVGKDAHVPTGNSAAHNFLLFLEKHKKLTFHIQYIT